MKISFVSNYINHHQIPFCRAMCAYKGVEFFFIQTQPMEEERVTMGWRQSEDLGFLRLYYEKKEECDNLIMESDVVLFGGCEDETYIARRLKQGRPVIRISERLYKEGQWKAISPRGLIRKYKDHTKYGRAPVYLLCAGAYVASDFHLVRAYPGKMYRWGYFPETKSYDIRKLMEQKGMVLKDMAMGEKKIPRLLWAARMIDWKHPELVVRAAGRLKERGIAFHLDMVGGGKLEPAVREMVQREGLEGYVSFPGFRKPEEVRGYMERADIYLMTSDRGEGWGAVVNEAMNSGCAVLGNHMAGAVPYLIKPGKNGLIYRDKDEEQFLGLVERLAVDPELCRRLGENAYRTITEVWNARYAAACLMKLMEQLALCDMGDCAAGPVDGMSVSIQEGDGPCTPAPVISERRMFVSLKGPDGGRL